jgi:hypothetical protein
MRSRSIPAESKLLARYSTGEQANDDKLKGPFLDLSQQTS